MKKLRWYGILFAVFMVFMYVMGIYDMCMMLGHDPDYFAKQGYGQRVVEYFTDYPVYFLVFWLVNLVAGLVAPILYLLRKRVATTFALVSVSADVILIVLTVLFRNRLAVLGTKIFIYDVIILLISVSFYVFCKKQEEGTK